MRANTESPRSRRGIRERRIRPFSGPNVPDCVLNQSPYTNDEIHLKYKMLTKQLSRSRSIMDRETNINKKNGEAFMLTASGRLTLLKTKKKSIFSQISCVSGTQYTDTQENA